MKAYLLGLLVGGFSALALVAGGFIAVMTFKPQNLIAPAISSVNRSTKSSGSFAFILV